MCNENREMSFDISEWKKPLCLCLKSTTKNQQSSGNMDGGHEQLTAEETQWLCKPTKAAKPESETCKLKQHQDAIF